MNRTAESARDSLRSSVSSPGIPNTYWTPSASRHSTKTSEARRSLTLGPYLNRGAGRLRLVALLAVCLLALAGAGRASAASTFGIRGGGDGHGIGLSQYGAYGYALHGYDYRSILAHYYQGTTLGATSPQHVVRVLLATGHAGFSGASAAGRTRLNPTSQYAVLTLASGALEIVNGSGKQVGKSFAAPLTVTGPGPLAVPGLGTYRGSLQFRPDGSGGVETVNAVGLDDYVRGVVAAEMPSSWAAQALEAQAVAARTYAITAAIGAAGYDLYDDTRSQVYGGVGAETAATDAAVAATSGQIVTYGGRPAVTYFFASSGGYTEDIQNVWAGATPQPWLRGVPDPYDGAGGDPYHRWSYEMSIAAAGRRLGSLVKGRLLGIAVTRHGVSPRILEAAVVGTRGRTSVSGTALQSIFGLPTTYATFTAISTNASAGILSGTIYPGRQGSAVWVQIAGRNGWHTIERGSIGRGGAYNAPLPGTGTYRVQSGGFNGPAVASRKTQARLQAQAGYGLGPNRLQPTF
jgi:stage II sporulation protein D